jgi:hypothetical protein
MPGGRSTAFRVVLAATLVGLVVMLTLAAVLGVMAASDEDREAPPPAEEIVVQPTANEEPVSPQAIPPAAEPPVETAEPEPPPAETAEPEPPAVTSDEVETKPLRSGPLEPGRYAVERFDPDFSVVLGAGWQSLGDSAEAVALRRGAGRNLTVLRAPSYVFLPGTLETRLAPDDLLRWMRDHPCVSSATDPAPVTVGGNPGRQIEFSIRADPGCSGAYWEIDEGRVYTFEAGERDRLIALTVNAQGGIHELVVNVSTADPESFENFLRRATRVLASIAFG